MLHGYYVFSELGVIVIHCAFGHLQFTIQYIDEKGDESNCFWRADDDAYKVNVICRDLPVNNDPKCKLSLWYSVHVYSVQWFAQQVPH